MGADSAGLFCTNGEYTGAQLRLMSAPSALGWRTGDGIVKLALALITLAGSIAVLASDWASQGVPYLQVG